MHYEQTTNTFSFKCPTQPTRLDIITQVQYLFVVRGSYFLKYNLDKICQQLSPQVNQLLTKNKTLIGA